MRFTAPPPERTWLSQRLGANRQSQSWLQTTCKPSLPATTPRAHLPHALGLLAPADGGLLAGGQPALREGCRQLASL